MRNVILLVVAHSSAALYMGGPARVGGPARAAMHSTRREVGRSLFLPAIAAAAAAVARPQTAAAATGEDPLVKLYFGAGCFWHVQHELVLAERTLLGRRDAETTAVSGYAGGTRVATGKLAGPAGAKVCYHNPQGVADYGRLGHAEAVQVEVPASRVADFASKYFSLFGARGVRHDPQDRGGEYRSVLGLPGGEASPLYPVIAAAAERTPMRLVTGAGDQGDTIGAKTVLLYDSDAFPFYPAELYHQFHNDFMDPPYGAAYNGLLPKLYDQKKIGLVGCPDMDPATIVEGRV